MSEIGNKEKLSQSEAVLASNTSVNGMLGPMRREGNKAKDVAIDLFSDENPNIFDTNFSVDDSANDNNNNDSAFDRVQANMRESVGGKNPVNDQALLDEISELGDEEGVGRWNEALEALNDNETSGAFNAFNNSEAIGQYNEGLYALERVVENKGKIVGIGEKEFARLVALFENGAPELKPLDKELKRLFKKGKPELIEILPKGEGENTRLGRVRAWVGRNQGSLKKIGLVSLVLAALVGLGVAAYLISAHHFANGNGPHNGKPPVGPHKPPVKPPVHPHKPPVKPPVNPHKPPVKPGGGSGLHEGGGTWHWGPDSNGN